LIFFERNQYIFCKDTGVVADIKKAEKNISQKITNLKNQFLSLTGFYFSKKLKHKNIFNKLDRCHNPILTNWIGATTQ
jgi:hypothetical protein